LQATEVNESKEGALLTSRLDISVLITDVDDEAPQCNRSSYTVHISENSPLQQPLTVVDASDITAFDLDQARVGSTYFHFHSFDFCLYLYFLDGKKSTVETPEF
jgi:hypothetical protein